MISRYEKMLIWRYLLPGAEGRIVVFVAAIGLTAVTIGVAALIVVMSVMNGARTKFAIQFASMDGHASISRPGALVEDWREIEAEARRQAGVTSVVPALDAPAMATAAGRAVPAIVRGLRPADMEAQPLFTGGQGVFQGFVPRNPEEVVVGSQLAASLGMVVGDHLTLARPSFGADGDLSIKTVGYRITGIVETGIPRADAVLVMMHIEAARSLIDSGSGVSRINVTMVSSERAAELLAPLERKLPPGTILQTWRELNTPIFEALALEQIGMFIGVSMVVLVALFNILSSLMMLAGSKVRDIAIMRTMGASRGSILRIFIAIGTLIGSSGATLGSLIGFSLVSAKESLASFAKAHVLGEAYAKEVSVLIDLPAHISLLEVSGIWAMAFLGTILASLYPAIRAANIDPAYVLRYD